MENSGLISVIIPVYNVEAYLRECVDSVLGQTYQNFEIILVDDGSKDGSPAICDEYANRDGRIRCIHKQNGGASTARNVGLDAAIGQFVFFLDSDDWLEPETLERLYRAIEEDEIDFSFCEAAAVDEKTGQISLKNYSYHRDYGCGSANAFFAEMVRNREFHVAIWMMMYRRAFLTGNALRFVEGIMYEDCIFAYQVYALARNAAHVHEFLYHRRYRAGSVMTAKKTAYNFISARRAYEAVTAFWQERGMKEQERPYVVRIAHNALDTYRALEAKDRRTYAADFKRLKADIKTRDAFSDRGLKAKCRGRAAWLLYKAWSKVTG